MPNEIDTSTIDFNLAGSGFTSDFKLNDTTTWPEGSCTLPTLLPLDLPTLDDNFTTLNSDCKYNFPAILPIPPVFIPKPEFNIPCPLGYNFSSNVSFTATGCTTLGGNLNIVSDPSSPCGYILKGGIVLDVPCPPCPDGMTFSGSPTISIEGNGASTLGPTGDIGPIQFTLTGGPCHYQLIGGGTIVMPPIPQPPASNNDTPGTCLDCSADCSAIATAIEAAYTAKGTTPKQGDAIDLCVFVYEVVNNATTTCPTTINVVQFTVGGDNYCARQISTKCLDNFPYQILFNGSGNVYLYTGTVNQTLTTALNTPITPSGSTQYVTLTISSSAYAVTGSTWSLQSSPPTFPAATINSPPSSFDVLIGIINAGAVTQQVVKHNIVAIPKEWLRVSNVSPVPFGSPYSIYWVWSADKGA